MKNGIYVPYEFIKDGNKYKFFDFLTENQVEKLNVDLNESVSILLTMAYIFKFEDGNFEITCLGSVYEDYYYTVENGKLRFWDIEDNSALDEADLDVGVMAKSTYTLNGNMIMIDKLNIYNTDSEITQTIESYDRITFDGDTVTTEVKDISYIYRRAEVVADEFIKLKDSLPKDDDDDIDDEPEPENAPPPTDPGDIKTSEPPIDIPGGISGILKGKKAVVSIELDEESYAHYEAMILTVTGITEKMQSDGAYIGSYKAGASYSDYQAYLYPSVGDSTIDLTAFGESGDYEMRLYGKDGDETILAKAAFTVVE